MEELLSQTVNTAVKAGAVEREALETVVVDTTVQEKAVAYPTDSRLPEVARRKVALEARRAGVELKQSCEKEGRQLRRRAGGYAHARQFRRLSRALKWRQAVKPVIGHMKQDNRMDRCWLKGAQDDSLNAVLAAAGYNLRSLLWAIIEGRVKPVFLRLLLTWRAGRIGNRSGTVQSLSRFPWARGRFFGADYLIAQS